MPVCVSILSGGCPHLCSFQKSPDAVPRAYKASFSIRKETAVKAADGLALRGPELGLITLLLPGMILVVSSVKHMLNSLELLVFNPCSWTDVQVVMTLVPRLVLSLRSSGKEGVFSTRGACVAWNEGFFGDRFTSVPLPKAWMAFPVGKEHRETEIGGHPHDSAGPSATFPVTAQSWGQGGSCPN